MRVPFNKPYISGNELKYIDQVIQSGKIGGGGDFTKKCHSFFEKKYGFKKILLTTSCTDALEMAALLLNIKEGDEVIIPSYTFVSSANAFILRGAKIVFADSGSEHPNVDVREIESLITPQTKVIVPVHYAGMACDMDGILQLARQHNLFVVEDAAQAIDGFYRDKPLGSIGHFGAISFHETKNIVCGEGGMLTINDERFMERAEIIREKGTNRTKFINGEVDKYGWVDVGSSFLPSELSAAFLYAQCLNLNIIQQRRKEIWTAYNESLKPLEEQGLVKLPVLPKFATNNAHVFYLVCKDLKERGMLVDLLKDKGIPAVFHYLSLHKSAYFQDKHDGRELPNADRFTNCLLRLPLYYDLKIEDVQYICDIIKSFFKA